MAILRAWGFSAPKPPEGSHETWIAVIKDRRQAVTVDLQYAECDVSLIKKMIEQSGLTREEFYRATKATAKKINKKLIEPAS